MLSQWSCVRCGWFAFVLTAADAHGVSSDDTVTRKRCGLAEGQTGGYHEMAGYSYLSRVE